MATKPTGMARGRPRHVDPARNRFIHAVIEWLLSDEGLHNQIERLRGVTNDALLAEWRSVQVGDPRWREAPPLQINPGAKLTLSTEDPSPHALGNGLGVAAMLLSRELPAEAERPVNNADDPRRTWTFHAIGVIHEAFEVAIAPGGHLRDLASDAGFPAKLIPLDRRTLRHIYNRIQAGRLDAGLARRHSDGHFDGDPLKPRGRG